MPEQPASDRILELALKGFLPLLLVGAGMYGFWLLFDRMVDEQQKQNDRIMGQLLKGIQEVSKSQERAIQDQIRFRAEIRQFLGAARPSKPAFKIVPKSQNPASIGGD